MLDETAASSLLLSLDGLWQIRFLGYCGARKRHGVVNDFVDAQVAEGKISRALLKALRYSSSGKVQQVFDAFPSLSVPESPVWASIARSHPLLVSQFLLKSSGPSSSPPVNALAVVAGKSPISLLNCLSSLPLMSSPAQELLGGLLDPLASASPLGLLKFLQKNSLKCTSPLFPPSFSSSTAARCIREIGVSVVSDGWIKVDAEVLGRLLRDPNLLTQCWEAAIAVYWPKKDLSEIWRTLGDSYFCSGLLSGSIALLPQEKREFLVAQALQAGGLPHTVFSRAPYGAMSGDWDGSCSLAGVEGRGSSDPIERCSTLAYALAGCLAYSKRDPVALNTNEPPRTSVKDALALISSRVSREGEPGRSSFLSTLSQCLRFSLDLPSTSKPSSSLSPLLSELPLLEESLHSLLHSVDTSYSCLSNALQCLVYAVGEINEFLFERAEWLNAAVSRLISRALSQNIELGAMDCWEKATDGSKKMIFNAILSNQGPLLIRNSSLDKLLMCAGISAAKGLQKLSPHTTLPPFLSCFSAHAVSDSVTFSREKILAALDFTQTHLLNFTSKNSNLPLVLIVSGLVISKKQQDRSNFIYRLLYEYLKDFISMLPFILASDEKKGK